ncbi:MAG: RNA polymerase factor sigma-54 [Planctomycetota bacterium]|nr:RNA polymerase factor sigma-54 [Planctomycetota bacterium]MDA1213131.1 RNA polymerase factor sigma-54 [Planctomycetota bacterium]
MQLNLSQQMKMSQQMKLAPRMIQSMEILQLPIMALQERIDQELSENEMLENAISETDDSVPDTELQNGMDESRDDSEGNQLDRQELVVDNEHNNEADFERLLNESADWPEDNVFSASKPSSNRISEEGDRQHDVMSNMISRPQSLHEYLIDQFHYFDNPPHLRDFGEYMIQNLDHRGRFQTSLAEMVQVYGRQVTYEDAEHVLTLIQKLDPPGVGARDLKECFLLQITPETPFRDVLITLVTSHLEDVAENRLPLIQRKTGYELDTIKAAIEELTHLNPNPGRAFAEVQVQKVMPDLFVEKNDEGKYIVGLLDEYTPRLRISKRYQELLRGEIDQKTREYIKRKIDSAKWLIESIEQRYNTLKRVAQAIVDHQIDFLDNGEEFIVPLKMQQIADVVKIHVTTVSRAVDDKWIQTPRGLFALKRFFGGGTTTAEGEEVAWDIVRIKLREIVDKEDKNDPLSDDALVDELAKQGYTLARRTVTKYRKALNIPSSRQRRVY